MNLATGTHGHKSRDLLILAFTEVENTFQTEQGWRQLKQCNARELPCGNTPSGCAWSAWYQGSDFEGDFLSQFGERR
jgi:hypothetical protein